MAVTLALKVTPRSGKDEIMGLLTNDDGSTEVAVRVTAPPDKGKANKAVCKLLATKLGIPKSAVEVKRGDTSHHKILELDMSQADLDAWVGELEKI